MRYPTSNVLISVVVLLSLLLVLLMEAAGLGAFSPLWIRPIIRVICAAEYVLRTHLCIFESLVILSAIFFSALSAMPTSFASSGANCAKTSRLAASCPVENISSI